MGTCTSRDATTPPSSFNSVLPPSAATREANKSSVDLSQPRSSPPSVTHPPLPSTLPDSDDPHSRHGPATATAVSECSAARSTATASPVLPATMELRADKELVWSLHEVMSAESSRVLDVVAGEEGEVLTAGADKYVVRFDWQRRQVRDRWKAHSTPVEKLLYCPHTRSVFTAGRDSNIRMLTPSLLPASSLSSATSPISSSGAAPGDVVFRGHTLSVSALCFNSVLSSSSPPPTTLVSGGRDYSVRWWDISTQQQQQMRIMPNNVVTALTAVSEQSVLLSANTAGVVHQWDSRTQDMAHVYESLEAGPIVSLSAHHSLPLILVTHSPAALTSSSVPANSSLVRLYDIRMRKLVHQTAVDEALVASYILPYADERRLKSVTVSAGGQVRVWSDGECLSSARVRGDSGVVKCASVGVEGGRAAASPSSSAADGRSVLLYTGSSDGNVCVWSLHEGGRLAVKTLIRSR